MYNVLEALQAGRSLTAKEKIIHQSGLISVLHSLHEDLDAAVLKAYGWDPLPPEQWLHQLTARDARRAAEEAAGAVRWLRPAFQNPNASSLSEGEQKIDTEHAEMAQQSLQLERTDIHSPATPTERSAWPADLPTQVSLLASTLAQAREGLTLGELEDSFKGRAGWKKILPLILATLLGLGRVRSRRDARGDVWYAQ